MKKHLVKFILSALFIAVSSVVFAQDPPPPPGGGHGQSGNQTPGGAAPIGSGVALLVGMAAAYGAKKVWDARKKLTD